ncbi:hypothetical protein ACIGDI_28165 [Streptomyces sp. NPDC085900]
MRRLHHPPVGDFSLRFETYRVAGDTDQALITYHAELESASAQSLRLLAS